LKQCNGIVVIDLGSGHWSNRVDYLSLSGN
jgi:hypothetical protein